MIRPFLLSLALAAASVTAVAQSRSTLFDFGWKFCEQDAKGAEAPSYDDSRWQRVDLPHDWDISHAPCAEAPTGNDGGYYPGGVGWYRKTFAAPAGADRVCLHFEGVYQKSQVYVNGQLAATHAYGYTPFKVDITPYLNRGGKGRRAGAGRSGGDNVVAVRVDNALQPNCRWYSGSGIYRHVWLQASPSLRIADNGVFVTTPGVSDSRATVQVEVTVENGSAAARRATVAVGGSRQRVTVPAKGAATVTATFAVSAPKLWSTESPSLYEAVVELLEGGKAVDRRAVKYGIRTFSFNAECGFMLNGKPMLLNGACVHHDNGVLGAMAFDRAEIRKVRLMKEAGFNLIRTSHNPATRAFMDACDSLGMLVIDETFDGWYRQKTRGDYSTVIDSCWREDLSAMVLRDRNHPSVICWSIGNEVMERRDIAVVTTARKFKRQVLSLDPTRPVTEALCSWENGEWPYFDPHAEVLDVVGYNYTINHHKDDHRRCPARVMWQTESYPRDAFSNWANTADYPYIVGDIVWTGLDYLGESGIGRYYYRGQTEGEHFQRKHFPWHGAYCGDVDITGWRKPISHYRQMLWSASAGARPASEQVYMAVREPDGYRGAIRETMWSVWPTWESWNWQGWEGKPIEVEVCTRQPEASLYLDGKLVGTRKVSRATKFKATFTLPYRPGELRADVPSGAQATLATAGEPAALRLTPDRRTLTADGQDLSFITLEVVDRNGRVVPDSAIAASVTVTGQGQLMAAASANFRDLEPTVSPRVTTWNGRALIVVRSTRKAGKVQVSVSSRLPKAGLRLETRK